MRLSFGLFTVVVAISATGCPSGDDVMSTAAPTVDVPEFAHTPSFVPVGESITFTANLGTTDGSALGDYDFRWNKSWENQPQEVLVEVGHPSHGVETITITPQEPGRFALNANVLANEQHAFTNCRSAS
ncbi:hypothetical protein BH11GEM2_BH11GEM2_33350 [soil metagenome]